MYYSKMGKTIVEKVTPFLIDDKEIFECKFRSISPRVAEYIQTESTNFTNGIQGLIAHHFNEIVNRGYTIRQPINQDLIKLIRADIDYKEKQTLK